MASDAPTIVTSRPQVIRSNQNGCIGDVPCVPRLTHQYGMTAGQTHGSWITREEMVRGLKLTQRLERLWGSKADPRMV